MAGPARAEEQALVGRCIEGDDDAWRDLVSRYAHNVSAKISQVYLRRLGRSATAAEAQEVAQETFVRLAQHEARSLRSFGWRCALATYLSAVAGTTALDRIRKESRASARMGPRSDLASVEEGLADGGGAPDARISATEESARLREAMQGLSRRDQLVLRMYYWEKVPPARIARALGTSADYVWTILKRSIEKLRKEIQ